jgi:hypothetical protein
LQPGEALPRQGAEVLAVELQEAGSVQHSLADVAMAVQGIEDRDPVRAADNSLAVERE